MDRTSVRAFCESAVDFSTRRQASASAVLHSCMSRFNAAAAGNQGFRSSSTFGSMRCRMADTSTAVFTRQLVIS